MTRIVNVVYEICFNSNTKNETLAMTGILHLCSLSMRFTLDGRAKITTPVASKRLSLIVHLERNAWAMLFS